ncbi:SidA/IucD/PvdA family monooxygenase [Streptomyces sp. NPDC048723]
MSRWLSLDAEAAPYDLVVVGLGPKAAAICAKVAAVRELGLGAPRVLVVEQYDAGAHWSGGSGFTTGSEKLGTRPEKDIGFPYRSVETFGLQGGDIDRLMMRYCWQSFLSDTGRFGDWVDQGCPAPPHKLFAAYLAWVVRACSDHVEIRRERVVALDRRDEHWLVRTSADGGPTHGDGIRARAVMMTGPGAPRRLAPASFEHPRLVDASAHRPRLRQLLAERPGPRVAVVGAGESAASLALFVQETAPEARVEQFAPNGMRVRDESHEVNRTYTAGSASGWAGLSEQERRTFIARTDRGVVSPALSERLNRVVGGRVHRSSVRSVRSAEGERDVLELHGDDGLLGSFDLVVNATGFDPWQQLDALLSPAARSWLSDGVPGGLDLRAAQGRIGSALAFDGLQPRLYVPALAGVTQGPGFANLSCLGHMSDLIVRDLLEHLPAPNGCPADDVTMKEALYARR